MSKWLAKQPQTSTATATTTCFSSLPRPAERPDLSMHVPEISSLGLGRSCVVLCCVAFGIQGFRLGVVASLI